MEERVCEELKNEQINEFVLCQGYFYQYNKW